VLLLLVLQLPLALVVIGTVGVDDSGTVGWCCWHIIGAVGIVVGAAIVSGIVSTAVIGIVGPATF